jgi:hypothetical protein
MQVVSELRILEKAALSDPCRASSISIRCAREATPMTTTTVANLDSIRGCKGVLAQLARRRPRITRT